jgi:4-hydroxy-4-methyl-2-oxoglutarate aldolase
VPAKTWGDVLVVDLFGKREGGTVVGDSLFYYVMKAANSGGLVVDASVREGLSLVPMPAYFRHAHPAAISQVMLSGIGPHRRRFTVMPGDLVVGDREGV